MAKLAKITKKTKPKAAVVRKAKPVKSTSTEVKPFIFRSAENKYLGDEPQWPTQPLEEQRTSKMIIAFSWYRYYFANKEAKEMLVHWLLVNNRAVEAKRIKAVPDAEIGLTQCWLARMNLMGLKLTEQEQASIDRMIENLLKSKSNVVSIDTASKPSIQDHILEKTKDIASELDQAYDAFVRNKCKIISDFKPIAVMRSMNLAPQHVGYIRDIWEKDLADFRTALSGEDSYVAESFAAYTKTQLKNMIKFAEMILADCQSYVQVKKTERKPRAKKAVSPEKLALKFKFLKEYPALKIKSEVPAKIVAASEAWLFDVAKRKIIHVVADMNAGSLTIKGSSVVGYDETNTVQKTIRKPEEIVTKFLKEGKPALRKIFKDIKTTETKWSGRSNENLVILRVW